MKAAIWPVGRRLQSLGAGEVLATVAAIEGGLSQLRAGEPETRAYRPWGDWLIREDYALSRFRRALGRPQPLPAPGAPPHGLLQALGMRIRARRVWARSRAAAVRVHSGIRCFYPGGPPCTLWIGLGKEARATASPRPELGRVARSWFARREGIRVPRVIAEDRRGEPPWILEETIRGRPFGREADWRRAERALIPTLFRFYDDQGVEPIPAGEVYDRERIVEAIGTLMAEHGSKLPRQDGTRFLAEVERQLEAGGETLPAVLGHGDLSCSNLLVDENGGIVIVDWEHCRRLPLAAELVKLLWQRPRYWTVLARGVEERTRGPLGMPARRQFVLAALEKLATLAEEERAGPSRAGDAAPRRRRKKVSAWLAFAAHLMGSRSAFPELPEEPSPDPASPGRSVSA